jgi:hypothetical protein
VAPGKFGPINAISPKYVGDSVARFLAAQPKPPMLWVRGDSDLIVSDNSFFDLGTLGKLGYVPGWPGEEVYPPQPMVGQTRHVLEQYAGAGRRVRGSGHRRRGAHTLCREAGGVHGRAVEGVGVSWENLVDRPGNHIRSQSACDDGRVGVDGAQPHGDAIASRACAQAR